MTRDLATADKIVKASIAGMSLILYGMRAIVGPTADVIAVVAAALLIRHVLKALVPDSDRNHV